MLWCVCFSVYVETLHFDCYQESFQKKRVHFNYSYYNQQSMWRFLAHLPDLSCRVQAMRDTKSYMLQLSMSALQIMI